MPNMTIESSHRRPSAAPVSLRLTPEERLQLERDAAGQSLSAYIRFRLFAGPARETLSAADKARLSPSERQRLLAQILVRLGGGGIGRALMELADAARVGILPMTPDITNELRSALRDVADLRTDLLRALGLKRADRGIDDPEG